MSESDVIVVGGGNAALCAALAAAERGARVTLLERAPAEQRGGNSFVTAGAFRFPYGGADDIAKLVQDGALSRSGSVEIGRYTGDELLADLQRVTASRTDPDLARTLVSQAFPTMQWLHGKGVQFVLAYDRQAFLVDGRHRFWGGVVVKARGEGPELITTLYRAAQGARVAIQYGARATELRPQAGTLRWLVRATVNDASRDYLAPAVVLACGGFEANPEMRGAHLGPRWKQVKVRGTPHNTGDGIRMGLAAGARPFGDWGGCHAVAWDLNAPGLNEKRLSQTFERDSYPLGVCVNIRGERFVDEGADFRSFTYARYGQEIMRQPRQTAFQIFDQKVTSLLKKPYTLPGTSRINATSWAELAQKAGIEAHTLGRTMAEFNAAVNARPFDPAVKDGKAAAGITPPKSNWAQRLDAPPYLCFPVTCGITFTFGGLKITPCAEVVDAAGQKIRGLYACGELAAGLFYENYPGGSGLMAGAVFGRVAGYEAAASAGHGE